jgi:hypothetical protein
MNFVSYNTVFLSLTNFNKTTGGKVNVLVAIKLGTLLTCEVRAK